jgi:hypothetical protein
MKRRLFCIYDTTLFVTGLGHAPALGLEFHIEKPELDLNSISVSECDTIVLPIYTSRAIPADVVDISFRLNYDKNKFTMLGIESEYFTQSDLCSSFVTDTILHSSSDSTDHWTLKNFCSVDSLKPIFTTRFVTNGISRDTSTISIDSIYFDTEDVILYEVLAVKDEIEIRVKEVSFRILGDVDFPLTQVLDCSEEDYQIENTGQIPLLLTELFGNSADTISVVSQPGINDTIQPGEIANVRLRFCPKRAVATTNQLTSVMDRCAILDSATVYGLGFAPDFYNMSGTEQSFIANDTLFGQIGEIVEFDLYIEKDIKIEFNGLQVYMEDVDFVTEVDWNPRALRFLNYENSGQFSPTLDSGQVGKLILNFENEPNILKGKIGSLRFLVTVPDVVESSIRFRNHSFDTDQVLFYTMEETTNDILFSSSQSCNISLLTYTNEITSLSQNYPNPWNSQTSIEFSISESDPVELTVYDINGGIVKQYKFASGLDFGRHSLSIDGADLESGIYYYELRNGTFISTKTMQLIK